VQNRTDTLSNRGPDVPMRDGATRGVEKIVHGGGRQRGCGSDE
jgi:hypothetical protein